ncbi:MAG: GntR family transcriptional regulator [Eubacteriales bacterium]|nr:GntR family transcriptional regulator [Eubacteriales bacterium]
MRFSEIVAPTIKELFVQKIEDSILSGELPEGTRLPSERELAEQMKISKTAVHAGITDMVRKGFLEVTPRKGIFVGNYAQNGTLEALTSIMQHNGGRLDGRTVRSLLEMRYAIESIAITRVAQSSSPVLLERLRTLVEEAKDRVKDPAHINYTALAELYFTFHHAICVFSGNILAPMIMNAFRAPSITFWANSARALGPEESVGRLETFYHCIARGDAAGALEHLKEITDNSEEIVRGEQE